MQFLHGTPAQDNSLIPSRNQTNTGKVVAIVWSQFSDIDFWIEKFRLQRNGDPIRNCN